MQGVIGEIRMFGGNFAPRSWAFCNGQLLAISSNTALFSIIGTTYGGDGRSTMQLPDLRGRTGVSPGNGPGLPSYVEGQRTGAPTRNLTAQNLPAHSHAFRVANTEGQTSNPNEQFLAKAGTQVERGAAPIAVDAFGPSENVVPMSSAAIGGSGGGTAFNVQNPYLALNYIICLFGIFPSRS